MESLLYRLPRSIPGGILTLRDSSKCQLEKQAHGNFLWFSKSKYKVLYLGWGTPGIQQAGDGQMESSPGEKDLGGQVGEAGHGPAMGTHSPESQTCPRLHPKHRGQQGKGGDSAPLLCSGETPPGVLHPALGSQHRKDMDLLD
ncbi:hypothetical protein DUI87_10133 [Hirundo rustica rustica]|uniref:Uncharacterized protein n=1 Tax=Hirundo rustica rustica TaxID=333673 RepID=A0A3M0KIZ2_HIRRU|nr:hypothetical protein DUI87_10133 [Hirundo rustica rustica]